MPNYPGTLNSATVSPVPSNGMGIGDSLLLFSAEQPAAPQASISFTPMFTNTEYAPAFTFEVLFSGAPGAFSLTIQEADTDADIFYIVPTNAAYTLNAVSGNQVVRSDLIPFGGRFGRVNLVSRANGVNITVRVTRVA